MKIKEIIHFLETVAPPSLQESYDNAGLITGSPYRECTGILVTLDSLPEIIDEALARGCNLIIAHHPIVFKGLKSITGKNYVEETIIKSIKHEIAIYAIHTNLDNVHQGVNKRIAEKIGLVNTKVLNKKTGQLLKLTVFVPQNDREYLLKALFDAGAGNIGNYAECSFTTDGKGTFKAEDGANPTVGKLNERHTEAESRIEVILPNWKQGEVLKAMRANHPYEEVAYFLQELRNDHQEVGSGLVGELGVEEDIDQFLARLKLVFGTPVVRHTVKTSNTVKKVAICGGAGSFLLPSAIASGADVYVTADVKYHEFFDAVGRIMLVDIGHFESEQFTIELLAEQLTIKFPNFAVLKTGINTNPVQYS